jgi:MFS family permease
MVLTLFSSAENRGTFQGYYSAANIGGRSLAAFAGLYSFQFFAADPRLGWYAIAMFTVLLALGFYLLAEPLQRDYSALRKHNLVLGVRVSDSSKDDRETAARTSVERNA